MWRRTRCYSTPCPSLCSPQPGWCSRHVRKCYGMLESRSEEARRSPPPPSERQNKTKRRLDRRFVSNRLLQTECGVRVAELTPSSASATSSPADCPTSTVRPAMGDVGVSPPDVTMIGALEFDCRAEGTILICSGGGAVAAPRGLACRGGGAWACTIC